MTHVLVMDMNSEQREKAAGVIVAHLIQANDSGEISLEKWEKECCQDILQGRSVTIGRLENLREIEKKYFSEVKVDVQPPTNCESMPRRQ